jgi:hypothetical protein
MPTPLPRPVLTVFRRAGCTLCDEIRPVVQAALEERAARGEQTPLVREVDVDADADLRARYGDLVPVLALSGLELPLAMSSRQVRAFLDRSLPRLA